MTFEMTRDYTVILPVILTVALTTAVRAQLSPASTLKLCGAVRSPRRGCRPGWEGHAPKS